MKQLFAALVSLAVWCDPAAAETYRPFSYPEANGGSTLLTGVRGIANATREQVYISGVYTPLGSSATQGLLYVGPITSNTGTWYPLNYPGLGGETVTSTALYGPNNLGSGVRVVGSYKTSSAATDHGVMYEGPASGVGGVWTPLQYPGSLNTIAHSNDGDLVVGNYDTSLDAGRGFAYRISTGEFTTLVFDSISPTSWTAYGVWQNEDGTYTIVGGLSFEPSVTGLDEGFMADYDVVTKKMTHVRVYNFDDQPATSLISHFDGVTSDGRGGFNLTGDWLGAGEAASGGLGFFANVGRDPDGTFTGATWLSIAYPGTGVGPTSGNTVYENYVLGVYGDADGVVQGYVATVPEPSTCGLIIAALASGGFASRLGRGGTWRPSRRHP